MSTTTKHTPGPWTTSSICHYEILACGTGAARVAKCLDEFDDNPGGPKFGSGEVEANAALIAAAPDLLAGVEAMEAAARETGQNIPIELAPAWGRLWEAAQKAKGGGA